MRLSNARLQAMAAGEHGARLATVREAVEMARELRVWREYEAAMRATHAAYAAVTTWCHGNGWPRFAHAEDAPEYSAWRDAMRAEDELRRSLLGLLDILGPVSD